MIQPIAARPAIEVVVPVLDEERVLARNVSRLVRHLEHELRLRWRVTIADNGSTDRTAEVAEELARTLPGVAAMRIGTRGRGAALRAAWLASDADVVAYMDVDLSTDLESLLPLVAPLLSGHSDIAIGTRLRPGAHVQRRLRREVLSRGYNLLLRVLVGAGFSDAQCGFKAMRTDAARAVLPLVEDDSWFFDTELLLLAERNGLSIFEVPVDWIEDLDSRVDVPRTIVADLRGIWRMRCRFWSGDGRLDRSSESTPALGSL
jgi:glycosyltransferase involved in cell wall biosynthesis